MGLNYLKWHFPLKVPVLHLFIAQVWEGFQRLTVLNPEISGNSATSLITHFILNLWLNITQLTSLKRIFY